MQREPTKNVSNTPRVGLFTKTFKADLDWLYFGLSSFKENWKTDCEIVVVAEPNCQQEIERWRIQGLRLVYVQPFPCGYCHAMASKLSADLYLPECELILLFDSDMMLTKPTQLSDLLYQENPTIIFDVWHTDIDQETRRVAQKVWVPAVRRSMGVDLDRDWLISPTWLYWRSTFAGARSMIESYRKMPFWQAVYCTHCYDWTRFMEHAFKLCDIQALGVYASTQEAHKYRILQRTGIDYGPVRQGWSHNPDGPPS